MALALGAASGTFLVVPPSYQDSVQVLFLGSPNQPGEKVLTNPFLDLSSTLISTADVIRLRVSTPQIALSLADAGAGAEYEIALDQSTPAPVLIVTTEDADPTTARRTSLAVVARIQSVLESVQQQAGAPRSTWVASTVISSLPKPTRRLNQSLRPALAAGFGIFAVTTFALFLFEGRSRRPRRGQADQPRTDGSTKWFDPQQVQEQQLQPRQSQPPQPQPPLPPRRIVVPPDPTGDPVWRL